MHINNEKSYRRWKINAGTMVLVTLNQSSLSLFWFHTLDIGVFTMIDTIGTKARIRLPRRFISPREHSEERENKQEMVTSSHGQEGRSRTLAP